MLKLLFITALLYFSYKMFLPKKLGSKKDDLIEDQEPDEFVDYEEID